MSTSARRVSVRALAEFYFEGGDLTREGDALARMQEGSRGHRLLQAEYPEGCESEVPLRLELEDGELTLALYGRADGVIAGGDFYTIEEIKTTVRDAGAIREDDYPVHWAQAELYALMLIKSRGGERVNVRLTYLNLAGGTARFTRGYDLARLEALAREYAAPYADWLRATDEWLAVSRPTIKALAFPYGGYRAGQRELAANAYTAFKEGKLLLCEAPTGIGKTAATLFPALKALGEGLIGRVFFLTARGTGAKAAEDALELMRSVGLRARHVTLTARDKICPNADCRPEVCPRAAGYYDRRRAALREALRRERFSRGEIEALAEEFNICPFELGLDLSELAEVVIGDYNYAFDPRVRLKRFFMARSDAGLLIDEAHNLGARAREMLSCTLSERDFRALRTLAGRFEGRRGGLYRALTALARALRELTPGVYEKPDENVLTAAAAFAAVAGERLNEPLPFGGELADCFFACLDAARVAGEWSDGYRLLVSEDGKARDARLFCADPAEHLGRALRATRGAVLFSATLTPLEFYRDALGLDEKKGDALLKLPSPFPRENLLTLCAPLKARYREREGSLSELAELLAAFAEGKKGNYLFCFPSHAYKRLALAEFQRLAPGVEAIEQTENMDEAARAEFLARLASPGESALAAFIALGGVFSEGVDLPGGALAGAAIVGTGFLQVCVENDVLRDIYGARYGKGLEYAYVYPGAARVAQAAGRVIRSERDRGAVLLLDERWLAPAQAALVPAHWRLRPVRGASRLKEALAGFHGGD